LEAAHNGHQRPQLTPPARPSPDGSSPGQVVAAPAAAPPYPAEDMGDGQPGVHLPIFEAARSDWFDEGDIHRDHLPLRRHGTERPHTAPEETAWADGVGPEPPPASAADPLQQPPPASAAIPLQQPPPASAADPLQHPPPPTSPAPPAGARHLRPEQPSWPPPPTAARHLHADQPSTPASSPPPAPATPLTPAGLPRRVPRANLAPGMLAEQEPPPVSPDPPPDPDLARGARGRSPEQVRSMLSSYRSGVERGRTQAGPESADASRSSRSDDDPTQ
jgi:hypothetical protein